MVEKTPEERRESAYQDVKMYIANDWELKEETPDKFILKRSESTFGGHVLVFFLTAWFTFGIGNVIYHYSKQKKKIILK